ncbi:CDK5 regulatory subunit-associated protein 3-like isoform X1 [Panulirus ornatus]|uniref:CDK5 regulatory subunit-associated protein 3-like isoform X1 n=1 Tax=Panulirus ornatus TaxID=150431 RepID=UPI003A8B7C77
MNEQDLPIDIHVGKLVEWLISRRHVKREWPQDVRVIREKINNAIQDMPEHPEITRLLSGTYINYFKCLKIVEILKETEKDSKNILGWYGSQRMKDWQEVVRLYEKDCVYLAEACQLLVRNINYEVPGIKRQISRGIQIQQECDHKEGECIKGIAGSKKKYLESCKQIGIAGDKVKHELVDLVKTLPEEFAKIAESSKSLTIPHQLYSDFMSFTLTGTQPDCLPLLKFVMEHGNVTTYEWLYGEAPCSIEEPQLHFALDDETDKTPSDQIDFGDGGGTIDFGDASGEIDFGDNHTSGEIDWGNLAEDSQTIDWGIGEVDNVETVDIVVEDSGVAGGVAKNSEALSILLNPDTRNQFINELHELEGFLGQRLSELETEEKVFSLNKFSNAPPSVQDHTAQQAREMMCQVKKILSQLYTTKMQHLFLISSSPRYVDRLAESLKSKLAVGEKLAEKQVLAKQRKQDAIEEQQNLTPKLALIIERTKELKSHIEEHISKKYKNRPVNLMGAYINMQL